MADRWTVRSATMLEFLAIVFFTFFMYVCNYALAVAKERLLFFFIRIKILLIFREVRGTHIVRYFL